jgi:hypothetical protein|nr:MAG TPA: hypothetical protein [Caudoviricetes sp.]
MIYDHVVNKNGVYYAAGDEVPEDNVSTEPSVEESVKEQEVPVKSEESTEEPEKPKRGRSPKK